MAPAGVTMTLAAREHELESFINYEALPRASLGVLRVAVELAEGGASLTLLVGDSNPVASVALSLADSETGVDLTVTGLRLGPLSAPGWARTGLARVLNDTLAAGEAGFTLQSLALCEGEAQLTVTRH